MVKNRMKSVLSMSAALSFLFLCTACESSNAGSETAELSENEVQEVQVQEEALQDDASIEQPVADEPDTLTKDQLYYRCLNSLEYLNQLSGSVSVFAGNDEYIISGTFELDFTNEQYHAIVDSYVIDAPEESIQTFETYGNHGEEVELFDEKGNGENYYTIEHSGITLDTVTFANACPVNPADAEAASMDGSAAAASIQSLSEDQLFATWGKDPTNAHALGACYIPQERTLGYLANFDNWEITGTQEVQGRTCAVVQGTADPEYGSRFGVETFEILVDQQTGVWMQFEGYDADGTVQAYVYTENVRFGADAEAVPAFEEEYAAGYTMQEMNDMMENFAE
ncbi:MAG: hypothetical protein ACI4JQ_00890 [Ruminococcus sp.]